jgi:hypothetical protein
LYFPGRVSIYSIIELGNADRYNSRMQVPHSAAVTVGTNTRVRPYFVTREPMFLEEENM